MKRILLAEDEVQTRRSIAIVLENAGYSVHEVVNGFDAADCLINSMADMNRFDLLLTDIVMPEMSGLELVNMIKQRQISLPIVIISGYGDRRMRLQLVGLGYSHFLDKPFEPEVLLQSIENALQYPIECLK